MGKKRNEAFLTIYSDLDKACAAKFGVGEDGITEYINRLEALRSAPKKDATLSRLVRYRNINKQLHGGIEQSSDAISGADIAWLRGFSRDLELRRDPISGNVRRIRRIADMLHHKWRKLVLPALLLIALMAIIAFLLILISKQ